MSFRKRDRFPAKSKPPVEEEPQPEPSTSRRPPKRPMSKAKKGRDEKRMEKYREVQGEKTSSEKKEALFGNLFFGYNTVTEAIKNLELNQMKRTINLPISTRSCGFIIRSLVYRFIRLGLMTPEEARVLAAALYRITLLQIDYRLEESRALQCSRNLDTVSFNDIAISGDMRRALELMGANFSPIVNYIHSVGFVKTAAKTYLPRLPKLKRGEETSPFYIHFTNLREVVCALHGEAMPQEKKKFFMEHSPIPIAEWSSRTARRNAAGVEVPPTIMLVNPDEIMPAGYSLTNVRNDLDIIATAVEKVGRKYPKYIGTGGFDWKGQGSISQIVSSAPARVTCPSWPSGGDTNPISGEHDQFWTAELISDPEAYMGVVYMVGETEPAHVLIEDCMSYRSMRAASQDICLDYASVMQNLIN